MSGFMKLQVWQEPEHNGSPISEADEQPEHIRPKVWWGQYSAPGYMDRTETCGPFASAADAARETFALFGDNEPGSGDRRELASILWNIRGAK